MVISSYYINNVLRVYGEQLKNGKKARVPMRISNRPNDTPDTIKISSEGKKRYLTEKMVFELIGRISNSNSGTAGEIDNSILKEIENELGTTIKIKEDADELKFKIIDEKGETIKTISGKDINI